MRCKSKHLWIPVRRVPRSRRLGWALRAPRPMGQLAVGLLAAIAALTPAYGQSLFQAETLADGTLYSDQVARRIGDLITIQVIERMSLSDDQSTETSRETTVDGGFTYFPNSSKTAAGAGQNNFGALPGIGIQSTKEFGGEGNFEADSDMTVTLTGRVIDTLDNGNLVIEARRTIAHDRDTKTITLTGIVRRADIDAENSIPSSQIHNFQIAITGEGPLSRSQQEGWLSRLMDVLWPF